MISGLDEPDSDMLSCVGPFQYALHQLTSHATVLRGWNDGNRTHARDGVALPEEVAADYSIINLRNY